MEVRYDGYGRALRNPVQIVRKEEDRLVTVRTLG
jgi:hypothetical protein